MSFYGTLIKSIEKIFIKCKFKNNLSNKEFLIEPKTMDDYITIESGDEWIIFSQPDSNINKIIVNHKEPGYLAEDGSKIIKNFSINNSDISNDNSEITIEILDHDKKGHLITNSTSQFISLNTNTLNNKVNNLTTELNNIKENKVVNLNDLALIGKNNAGRLILEFKNISTI